MNLRSLLYAALGGAFILSAGVPAYAQPDHHDQFDHGRGDHGHYDHRDFHHPDWRRGYEPPPIEVAPPAYGYYSPPPVAYVPAPGISFGINLR